ncbi:Gfo/Idh/MocA family oxidoreductase [Pseudoalteromonas luteoviolacea]|uniref:Gfo/Idh/MocA family protein n=1 Tax=Pseudoalteromonas luteoviolacea TaxID=43657 RepID=UPI001F1C649F|nr:Gfo/Idh/MocA family oxidoreductase [Pseudoalteromonas luteoviolacea]MCF6440345.1 Gfo/Idh/MocA family oxidoreductase [Pseudoalteromonas luteoviolacea]
MQNLSPKIKLGFVGAGFIGQVAHIENYAQLEECELKAIADLRPVLREEVADKFAIKQRYESHKELLDNADIDAIVIVTARVHTADVVRDCLLAGKHVFSEKPMAGNSLIAAELVELAAQKNLVYCVGYMKRHDLGVIKAKQLFDQVMANKSLGNLLQVSAQCYMGDSYCKAAGYIHGQEQRPQMQDEALFAPDWLRDEHKSLFARYVNVHSHLLNLIRHFLNTTPRVEYFNYLSPLAHTCVMRTESQLIVLETGEVNQKDWQEKCTFIFELGQLIITLPPALLRNVPAHIELRKHGEVSENTHFQVEWSWSFKNQANAFIKDVKNKNTDSTISAQQALTDIQLAEAIWKKLSN